MLESWVAWCFLALLAAVAGLWVFIVASPSLRSNMRHRVEPEPEDCDGVRLLDEAMPSVALLCPGRDEAEHLPTVLPELCEQDYPKLTVVFIDDASSDATPAICEEVSGRLSNLLAIRNHDEPPAGWVGKCWAIHQGYEALQAREAEASQGTVGAGVAQWVCFTDADIHWDPRCLRRAVEHAESTGADVVALIPLMQFGTASEAVVQMQLALAMGIMFPMDKAMDPAHPDTLTGGAFILARRSLYDQIGGHAAVKNEVVEDLALGRALKAAGGKIAVAMAPGLLRCRMYDGAGDMWEGLTKNAFAGMEYSWIRLVGTVVAVMLANVLTPVYVAAAAVWLAVDPGWGSGLALGLAALGWLTPVAILGGMARVLGVSLAYAWAMPIGSAAYLVIILGSVWHYCRGGNRWKGRSYRQAGA